MVIEHKSSPLYWGALDISLFGIQKDWEQNPLEHPAAFGLAIDHENFWFITSHKTTSSVHPDAEKGAFTPELWKYDVAEFFMRHPETGCYLSLTSRQTVHGGLPSLLIFANEPTKTTLRFPE